MEQQFQDLLLKSGCQSPRKLASLQSWRGKMPRWIRGWFVSQTSECWLFCGCIQLKSSFFSICSVMNMKFQDHCCCHRCFVLRWEDGRAQIQKLCRGILEFWNILNDHREWTPATASEQKQQAGNNPVWKFNTSAWISTFSYKVELWMEQVYQSTPYNHIRHQRIILIYNPSNNLGLSYRRGHWVIWGWFHLWSFLHFPSKPNIVLNIQCRCVNVKLPQPM